MSAGNSGRNARIVLVSSEPMYREGMQLVFRREQLFVLVEGTTIADAAELARSRLADLVLIETNKLREALEKAKVLVSCSQEIPLVALAAWATIEEVRSAFELGMRGCILKRVEGKELVRILESIGQGNSYVPPELAAGLLQRSDLNGGNQHEGRPYNLTAREAQVLDCAARALTNKEIARELQISEKTVKRYMTVIMEKLQVSNRVQAILKIKGDHRSSGRGRVGFYLRVNSCSSDRWKKRRPSTRALVGLSNGSPQFHSTTSAF